MKPTFKMDFREFDRALGLYMERTHRAVPDVLNRKAFFIARGAVRNTPFASKGSISRTLGRLTRVHGKVTGMHLTRARRAYGYLTDTKKGMSPLAGLIINRRRGLAGLPGLTGSKMSEAIAKMIGARVRSIHFLQSGWLPAIRKLEPLVRGSGANTVAFRGARQVGVEKGGAVPARGGIKARAIIENRVRSEGKRASDALIRYGGPAFQQAFDAEARSMIEMVRKRQLEEARQIGIRVMG